MQRTGAPTEPCNDNSAQKLKRHRESEVWGATIDLVGAPRQGVQYTFVGDRASDNYEVFLHLLENDHGWILRAKSRNRMVFSEQGERMSLAQTLPDLKLQGSYELDVRGAKTRTKTRPARTAQLEVLAGTIELPRPRHHSAFAKQQGVERVTTNVIWVREVDPPSNKEKVEWILYTSLPVDTYDQ